MSDEEQSVALLREPPADEEATSQLVGLPRVRDVRAVLTPIQHEVDTAEPKSQLKPKLEKRIRLWTPPSPKPQMATMSDLALMGTRSAPKTVARADVDGFDRSRKP